MIITVTAFSVSNGQSCVVGVKLEGVIILLARNMSPCEYHNHLPVRIVFGRPFPVIVLQYLIQSGELSTIDLFRKFTRVTKVVFIVHVEIEHRI